VEANRLSLSIDVASARSTAAPSSKEENDSCRLSDETESTEWASSAESDSEVERSVSRREGGSLLRGGCALTGAMSGFVEEKKSGWRKGGTEEAGCEEGGGGRVGNEVGRGEDGKGGGGKGAGMRGYPAPAEAHEAGRESRGWTDGSGSVNKMGRDVSGRKDDGEEERECGAGGDGGGTSRSGEVER
jgi:hypothetical protein